MNLIGRMLANRYEILEKIGNGGMATVYKAKCHVLNRFVAVKVLKEEFITDIDFIKRFRSEAQTAASLTHPNIVSIYDVGNEGDVYYIVMELIQGKTLKEIIVEDGKLSWKWSVNIAIQIASALETAHKNNLIHRDIKPHNIIITEDGVAKVTDFGIAKAVSNSTITAFGTTIGSVHYFSPEHARGGFTDAKSDLYSLGVVMYEMVTGRVPFDSDTPVSVALKHMQEEPIEPIVLKPDLPKSVNDIILKAMKKNTEERYASATEMLKDLERALKQPDGNFVFGDEPDNFKTQRIDLDYITKSEQRSKENKEEPKGKFAKMKKFFEEHKAIKIICIILACILVFSLAMGGTYLALTLGRAKEVQVPDLLNMTLEQAQEEAKKLKIKIQVQEEKYHLEIPEGQIIEQDPKYQNNYKIKEGSTIKVIVSKGQEIVKMPKVVGLKRDEAINLLKETGLEYEVKEENSDDIEKGIVIKQETEEGKEIQKDDEIPAGTKIIIRVSMGIEQVEVPDLSGKTESEAKTAISNAKLKWKSTEKTSDSSKPNGVVVNQSISNGSMVDKNTEITITINEFDEIKTGTVNVNVKSLRNYTVKYKKDEDGNEVALDPEKVTLKIIAGEDIIYNSKVSEAETGISANVSGIGVVKVKVYIEDVLYKTDSINLNTQKSLTIE